MKATLAIGDDEPFPVLRATLCVVPDLPVLSKMRQWEQRLRVACYPSDYPVKFRDTLTVLACAYKSGDTDTAAKIERQIEEMIELCLPRSKPVGGDTSSVTASSS